MPYNYYIERGWGDLFTVCSLSHVAPLSPGASGILTVIIPSEFLVFPTFLVLDALL